MIFPVLLAVLAATGPAQGRDTVRVDTRDGSRVWIEGGSNVHDWACKATAFDARVELDQRGRADEVVQADLIRRVSVKLAVRDLKCGNRHMETDLYSALKADDPAVPAHILAVFDAVSGQHDASTLATHGTLQVAGVEQSVKVQISTEHMADGTVRARGSVPLLMTDFGVKPPVGLFGLIRSKNEVTVKFDLLLTPRMLVAPTTER